MLTEFDEGGGGEDQEAEEGLEPERLLAKLFHDSEGRFDREKWLDADDNYLINVVGRPNEHDGKPGKGYWPVPRWDGKTPPPREINPRQLFFLPARVKAMCEAGWTQEQMDAACERFIESWEGF